jgi:DNA-binding CsgD family transcriptional regulator
LADRSWQELVETAIRAQSVEDIHALCADTCRQFGFDYFIYGSQLPTSLVKPQYVIISGFPQDWWEHYRVNGYMQVDPTVAHCVQRITPLVWAQIGADGVTPNHKVHRFMTEAHDFGLKSGASFPVHGCQGESAILSLVSTDEHPRAAPRIREAMPYAQLLAGYIHEAVRRVFADSDIKLRNIQLTEREKECLLWAAEGKTAWETSQILNISERTVIFHLQNAAQKLDVTNRSQAVARAITQSIITPQLG